MSWIIGIGYVYDQLDAAARATDTIVCAPAQMSVSDLANLTATLIAESFESGDVEAVFQAIDKHSNKEICLEEFEAYVCGERSGLVTFGAAVAAALPGLVLCAAAYYFVQLA